MPISEETQMILNKLQELIDLQKQGIPKTKDYVCSCCKKTVPYNHQCPHMDPY